MKTVKWHSNKKRNAFMRMIAGLLLDPEIVGYDELVRYVRHFPREVDYNVAQYGSLWTYSHTYIARLDCYKIWHGFYVPIVGQIVRRIVEEGREAWQ